MGENHISTALFIAWLTSWISFVVASWAWCLEISSMSSTVFWILVNLVVLGITALVARKKK